MHTDKNQAQAAVRFVRRWKGRGYERGESQTFWLDLLMSVFGVADATAFIRFEEQVKVDTTNFIDAHIPSTRVLIEQKSLDKDLRRPIVQSDGTHLTPFEQARRYVLGLPLSQHPRWIVVCNFREFLVYDMERPNAEPESILLENLGREYYRLSFLVDSRSEALRRELEVSVEAGNIIGTIYDALLSEPPAGMSQADYLHALNTFCVRLVFCFYAEDAGVFRRNQFHDYLIRFHSQDFRQALIQLFDVLSTPPARRDPFLEPALAAFPYVNGGLFASGSAAPGSAGASPAPIAAPAAKVSGEVPTKAMTLDAGEAPALPGMPAFPAHRILIPPISLRAKTLILERASAEFDWSEISPTIFGAVFESTLNPETRRAGGMHYTAIENIHRVIDPLFLNDLRSEFAQILSEKVERKRRRQLDAFQERLASLRFLDPACGSGNFLTETYLSLRRLENEVIRERYRGQAFLGFEEVNPVKVSIRQFYGIEVNDFAVTVAKTALWISEAQMLAETEKIISRDLDFLPLKAYTNILEANALRTDWPQADYVIGNPPFVGYSLQTREQKADVLSVFGKKWKNVGKLDYVCCWYKKAADLMQAHPQTRTAFVSTNSITQGEQVAALWKALPISILFAHRTFRWDSEASLKAHVHCVIIGFAAALTGYAAPGSAGASPAPIAASAAKVSGEVPTKAMTLDAGEAPALPGGQTPTRDAGEAPALPGAPALPDWHNRGYLPHRDNVSYQSITFRLFDAVPTKLIKNWKELSTWSEQLNEEKERAKQARKLIAQYEDQGIGCCYLKNESIADIVQQTLLYDDGKVYDLIRWCIMPNHVHVLIKVYEGKSVAGIVQTWKSITTHKANKLLHRTGQLWMSDYFDRYIRNAQHYDNVIRYIDNNPVKAKLSMTPEEWKWSSAGYATLGSAGFPGSAGASPALIAASAAKVSGEVSTKAMTLDAGEAPALPGAPALPVIFDGDKAMPARHINAYLMDAPDVFVESRKTALCEVPQMVYGSKPTEGGNLFITSAERDEILRREPGLQPFIRPTMGAEEFIKGKARYVLWLKEATPSTISHSLELRRRVEAVRAMRLASPKEATRQCAQTPWLFQEDRQPPSGHYLLVPRVSSERRRYVPIGFMSANVIASDAVQIIPHATLYHFGVLTSSVHMAWMRTVCGRLKSDFRYSKDVVYNNFPWPPVSAGIPGSAGASPAPIAASAAKISGEVPTKAMTLDAGEAAALPGGQTPTGDAGEAPALPGDIAATAQAILDARALYPDSSLADLYDVLTMPPELRRAHAANDRAVLAAYGLPPNATDDEILTHLFTMYRELTSQPLSPP